MPLPTADNNFTNDKLYCDQTCNLLQSIYYYYYYIWKYSIYYYYILKF